MILLPLLVNDGGSRDAECGAGCQRTCHPAEGGGGAWRRRHPGGNRRTGPDGAHGEHSGFARPRAGHAAEHHGCDAGESSQRWQRWGERSAHRHGWPHAAHYQRGCRPDQRLQLRPAARQRQQVRPQTARRFRRACTNCLDSGRAQGPGCDSPHGARSGSSSSRAGHSGLSERVDGPARKQEQASSSPQPFVFVEPTYKAKPEAKAGDTTPALEPPARTVEAAAKFVDKPEGNLLPTPSAAMQPQNSPAAPAMPQFSQP